MRLPMVCAVVAAVSLATGVAQAQVTKESVPGVTNFARVETTIACAGATTPAAVAELKRMGYRAIINLRLPSEDGADVEGEAAAARAAGVKYVSLPFNGASPDPAVVDRFLEAVTEAANQPVFLHCHTGNRAAALWMIKRMVVDRWGADRAASEATALGLTSSALKTFALEYAAAHKQ
jgi:uncharacterized protein (TIGR01244 family)